MLNDTREIQIRGTVLDPLDEGRSSLQRRENLLTCEAAEFLLTTEL